MVSYLILAAASAAAVQPHALRVSGVQERYDVCASLATDGGYPPLDLRACLSLKEAPEAVFRAGICDYLRNSEQLQDYHFSSHSDCMRKDAF